MQNAREHSGPETGNHHRDAKAEPVVLLFTGGPLGWCIVNYLQSCFDNLIVIQEQPEGKIDVVRRRARLLGWWTALGQAAFGGAIRLLEPLAARQCLAIMHNSGLDPRPRLALPCFQVPSVNSEECLMLLKQLNPAVIAVYGTRLLKPEKLTAQGASFINYHAGICQRTEASNRPIGLWSTVIEKTSALQSIWSTPAPITAASCIKRSFLSLPKTRF